MLMLLSNVEETIKIGDEVQVKHPLHPSTVSQQRKRTIVDNTLSDIAETDIYTGPGITENTFKPFGGSSRSAILH